MHRILRVPPRDSLCTTEDGDAIKDVHGQVIVWWYERLKKNFDAQSIPYVDVIFRYLDRYDEPAGHVARSESADSSAFDWERFGKMEDE